MNRRDSLRLLTGVVGGIAAGSFLAPRARADEKAAAKPAAPPSFDKVKIGLEPLATGISLLTGPGGNIAVQTGPDGVLLIDCGVPGRTDDIRAAVAEISKTPIKLLANTHWHFDHAGGNEALGKAGVPIVAHDNVRKRLSTDQTIAFMNMKAPAQPAAALPTLTFADSITLHRNGEEIHAFRVPPAHTDGDTIFHFRKANIVHAGDLFFNGLYPFIDASSGGNLEGMIGAADALLKVVDADTKIIPGHGPIASRSALKAYRDMLVGVRDSIKPLIDAGKTKDEVVAAKPTHAFDEKWGKAFLNPDLFTTMLFGCYEAQKAK